MRQETEEAMKLIEAYENNPNPSEKDVFLAAEACRKMIEEDMEEDDGIPWRYTLGCLYFQQEEYDLAAELFEENYRKYKDWLSGIELARCMIEPFCSRYDEEQAQMIASENYYPLKSELILIRILTQGKKENRSLEKAWQILLSVWPEVKDQAEFPNQPFPELAAIYAWYQLFVLEEPDLSGLGSLLEEALEVLGLRMKDAPVLAASRRLRHVLQDLLDEWDAQMASI